MGSLTQRELVVRGVLGLVLAFVAYNVGLGSSGTEPRVLAWGALVLACVTLHLDKLWIRDVTTPAGLVDARTTLTLLKLIERGRLDSTPFATHRLALPQTDGFDLAVHHDGALAVAR